MGKNAKRRREWKREKQGVGPSGVVNLQFRMWNDLNVCPPYCGRCGTRNVETIEGAAWHYFCKSCTLTTVIIMPLMEVSGA